MSNKGFITEKELEEVGFVLDILPFASSAGQMSASHVAYTNLIEARRMHAE